MQPARKPFNYRAFVSLGMLVAGLALPVSGIVNHNLQFELLSQQRHFWMSVHNMSALLCTVFAVCHIVLNRRPIFQYARRATTALISKEALAALVLVAGLVGLFSSHALAVH